MIDPLPVTRKGFSTSDAVHVHYYQLWCLAALLRLHRWTKATLMLKEMLDKDISPDVETFNVLINTFCIEGRLQVARHVIDVMRERGISPNVATYNPIIDAHCLMGGWVWIVEVSWISFEGLVCAFGELFEGLSVKRLKPTSIVYTTMIGGYCAEGLLNDAKQLFLEMEENFCLPTDTTFNFLQGYLQNNCYDDVEMLLHKMEERDHRLYDLTLSLLRESVAAGSLDTSILELMNNLPRSEGVDLIRFFFHD
ncbi:tetratricopeptide-like helical domain-containing protein [Tanacetum coccineum]